MIVDGDREDLLGVILADHVVVEALSDLLRRRNAILRFRQRGLLLLTNDVRAKLDAFVADEHGRAGNELAHLVLAFAAERAMERGLGLSAVDLAHLRTPTRCETSVVTPAGQTTDRLLLRSFSALRRCRLLGPRISARPRQAEF